MKKRRRRLGSITDNPREIFAIAQDELSTAKTRLERRQAAEKAHLALTSAVEKVAGRNLDHKTELKVIKKLANRLKSHELEGAYRKLRKRLHGDCFHQDQCSTVEKDFGAAELMLALLLENRRR